MKIEFDKLNAKAIILGTLLDVVASTIFGFIIAVIAGVLYIMNGGNIDNIDGLTKYYHSNIVLMLVSLIFGLLFTILGGYIAGKIAKGYEIQNSITVGVIGIIIGLFFLFELPLWYNILAFIATIPAAYLGGILAKRHNIAKNNKAEH